ncbi:hypothetical protein [Kordia sp.]|uniref:hypothetical protein n=1 Tax=Kordia sp. TaxID=1965332 RepID=UPI0038632638
MLSLIFFSCENATVKPPKRNSYSQTFKHQVSNKSLFYELNSIDCSYDIQIPIGAKKYVEIYDHWVIIHYADGRKIVVNREEVKSISVK